MSWLGAGIGVGIGFALGGPIGAVIGLWIGAVGKRRGVSQEQQRQTLFFVSLFSMLAKMARADGVVVEDEIRAVTEFMDAIKLDAQDKQAAIKIFQSAKLNEYSIYEYASQYKKIASEEMRLMVYATLWTVAYSDGSIHKTEDDILRKIPHSLGLDNSVYHDFSTRTLGYSKESMDKYYQLLGCSRSDTDSKVKQSYRRTISEYHPDKIQSKGLPKEFIKFANEQTKKINKAYKAIKKDRAIN